MTTDRRKERGAATKERLLEATSSLIATHGYAGTGMNQVLADAKAPRGSLYHHFPGGKSEIVSEAIRHSGARQAELMSMAIESAPDLGVALELIVGGFAARLEESDFSSACPIAPVVLDCDEPSVRGACGEVYDEWASRIAKRLQEGGASKKEARDVADLILITVEGALVLALARHDRAPLDLALAHLKKQLAPFGTGKASKNSSKAKGERKSSSRKKRVAKTRSKKG